VADVAKRQDRTNEGLSRSQVVDIVQTLYPSRSRPAIAQAVKRTMRDLWKPAAPTAGAEDPEITSARVGDAGIDDGLVSFQLHPTGVDGKPLFTPPAHFEHLCKIARRCAPSASGSLVLLPADYLDVEVKPEQRDILNPTQKACAALPDCEFLLDLTMPPSPLGHNHGCHFGGSSGNRNRRQEA
jgi:hypothetical protein